MASKCWSAWPSTAGEGMPYQLAPTVVVRSFEYETVLLDRTTLQMYSLSVPAFRQLEALLRLGAVDDQRSGTDDQRDADQARRFAGTLLRMGILVEGQANPGGPEPTQLRKRRQWDQDIRHRRAVRRGPRR